MNYLIGLNIGMAIWLLIRLPIILGDIQTRIETLETALNARKE